MAPRVTILEGVAKVRNVSREGLPTFAGSRKYAGTDFLFAGGMASRLTILEGRQSLERKPGRLTYFRGSGKYGGTDFLFAGGIASRLTRPLNLGHRSLVDFVDRP